MADYRITSPRLQVLRGSLDAPEVIEIQTLNPDLIAWDRMRAKHRWPEIKDAPMWWLTFIAWHACRREGRIPPEVTWEEFETSTLNVASLDEDDEDSLAVDPTHAAAAPD